MEAETSVAILPEATSQEIALPQAQEIDSLVVYEEQQAKHTSFIPQSEIEEIVSYEWIPTDWESLSIFREDIEMAITEPVSLSCPVHVDIDVTNEDVVAPVPDQVLAPMEFPPENHDGNVEFLHDPSLETHKDQLHYVEVRPARITLPRRSRSVSVKRDRS